jgi:hypothetical protein
MPLYDAGMKIDTLAQLVNWAAAQAADIVQGLPPAQAGKAVEDIAGVIWRHAFGQGLRPGDDWGWILAQYDSQRLREIVAASAEPPNRRGR